MKQFKFKLFILSAILLTLSSGLLFYRNLFLTDVSSYQGKNNFEELRYLDLKINEQVALERRHLESDFAETNKDLELIKNKIHDLVAIVLDLHLKNPTIKNSVKKIENYFNNKNDKIITFQAALRELRLAVNGLNSTYREVQKRNPKFILENKDFYRECMTDAFWYLNAPTKENEAKLLEDKKILSQIIGIASRPEESVQKYMGIIDTIIKKNTELEEIFSQVKVTSIDEEMTLIANHFKETRNSESNDGQIFLALVFVAIIVYIISLVIILRKF